MPVLLHVADGRWAWRGVKLMRRIKSTHLGEHWSIAESLYCAPEIIITLYVNYTLIKKEKTYTKVHDNQAVYNQWSRGNLKINQGQKSDMCIGTKLRMLVDFSSGTTQDRDRGPTSLKY